MASTVRRSAKKRTPREIRIGRLRTLQHRMARRIEIRTTVDTVAQALVSDTATFNEGCYYGTRIRLRQMTGRAVRYGPA